MRKQIIVFFIVFIVYIISNFFKIVNNTIDIVDSSLKRETKKVNINYNNNNSSIDLEEYVIGVVACEMPASFNIEALKALSVSARTYAMYKITNDKDYVLSTTTSDQCFIDKPELKEKWKDTYDKYYNKIKKAVEETNNQVMTYKDEIIIAFYFSISNGYTENVENVFSQKLDYLVSVDSSWDKEYNYKEDIKELSIEDFEKKLKITSINKEKIFIKRYDTGRVKSITINNKSYKGTEFRKLFSLKSTDFTIDITDKVIIKTKGYGHGVGLSQYGANAMANNGYKYNEILEHYYNGIKIVHNY